MYLTWCDPAVRLTGRWDRENKACAVTTTPGAYLECAFTGPLAVLHFDTMLNQTPFPHLWVQVDGSAMVEVPLDRYLRVNAGGDSHDRHIVTVIYKGNVEIYHRWYAPLMGKISFLGLEAEGTAPLPEDNRPTIEFVGDSITEGVLIDASYAPHQFDQFNRPYQDDVCATYAWRTAQALNLRPIMMGYGAVGTTKPGCGSVPKASLAYPYNFDGSKISHPSADYILINHGANDKSAGAEAYLAGYKELLDCVVSRNPHSKIICLSAFCNVWPTELKALITTYNSENETRTEFIDSDGWIPPEPLHPLRDGHAIVARHLTQILKEKYIK